MIDLSRQFYLMHSYIPMILVIWIIEGPDNRGPDNRGSTVIASGGQRSLLRAGQVWDHLVGPVRTKLLY